MAYGIEQVVSELAAIKECLCNTPSSEDWVTDWTPTLVVAGSGHPSTIVMAMYSYQIPGFVWAKGVFKNAQAIIAAQQISVSTLPDFPADLALSEVNGYGQIQHSTSGVGNKFSRGAAIVISTAQISFVANGVNANNTFGTTPDSQDFEVGYNLYFDVVYRRAT